MLVVFKIEVQDCLWCLQSQVIFLIYNENDIKLILVYGGKNNNFIKRTLPIYSSESQVHIGCYRSFSYLWSNSLLGYARILELDSISPFQKSDSFLSIPPS